MPNEKIRKFFYRFSTNADTEMPYFTKMKIILEISHKRLSLPSLLIDKDKLKRFEEYCEEYQPKADKDDNQSEALSIR